MILGMSPYRGVCVLRCASLTRRVSMVRWSSSGVTRRVSEENQGAFSKPALGGLNS